MYETHKEKIVATIEARMTSSRLPGKVLMPLSGQPALKRLVDRLKKSKYLDEIVVATTVNKADDPIVELAKKENVKHFRGSELDVLKRVLDAAKSVKGDIIIEITGDCPLINAELVDQGIQEYFSKNTDYISNFLKPGYSAGLNVQVFSVKTLSEVDKLTNDPIDRVHVSYYIYNHPEKFKISGWEPTQDCYLPEARITLDEKADYDLINLIFEKLLPKDEYFKTADIVDFLKKNPNLMEINKHVRQKRPEEG